MAADERREEAIEWLQFAADDLETAQALANLQSPKLRQSLFHAQQAAEKTLKAFLIKSNTQYLLTHNLAALSELCVQIDSTLHEPSSRAIWLTQFAVRFRYPGEEVEITLADANQGIDDASAIYEAVLTRVTSGKS